MRLSYNHTTRPEYEAKYGSFMGQEWQTSLFGCVVFLRAAGMRGELESCFETADWKAFLNICDATDVQDTYEFLASQELLGDGGIRYRHRGVLYEVQKRHLRRAFGWVESESEGVPSDQEAWGDMTRGGIYASGQSIGAEILGPHIFYAHKVISGAILAQVHGATKPTKADLAIFKGLHYHKKVDFHSVVTAHWARIRPSRPMCAGGLITRYLHATHASADLPYHFLLEPKFYDFDKMKACSAVKVDEESDAIVWSHHKSRTPVVAGQQGTSRQSTRQSRAREAGQVQAREDDDSIMVFRRWAFNMARIADYMVPPRTSLDVAPPAGWMPGDGVPAEYTIGEENPRDDLGPGEYSGSDRA